MVLPRLVDMSVPVLGPGARTAGGAHAAHQRGAADRARVFFGSSGCKRQPWSLLHTPSLCDPAPDRRTARPATAAPRARGLPARIDREPPRALASTSTCILAASAANAKAY
eukprot:COSAG01_NODE_341_length_18611_cov_31.251513_22_plen_111_part_00